MSILLKLRKILFHISLFTLLDDHYCLSCIEESIDLTCSRFFQILVVFPEVLGLLLPVRTKLWVVGDMVHALIVCEDSDDLIIDFTSIIELHDPDNANFRKRARDEWFSDSYDLDIEWIIVEIPRTGDRSVCKWVGERRVSDTIEFECSCFRDNLIFIDPIGIIFYEGVHSKFSFIGKSRKYMEKIEHIFARRMVDICHRMMIKITLILRILKIMKKQSRKLVFFYEIGYYFFKLYVTFLTMFNKILFLSICLILSACGNTASWPETPIKTNLPLQEETFESNYARIIEDTLSMSSTGMIWTMNHIYSSLYPSGYDNSLIRIAFDIPKKASGDLSLAADAVRETYKKLSAKVSLTGSLTNMSGETLVFQDVRWQLVANIEKSRYYGIIEALDIDWLSPSMMNDFKEIKGYIGKWWMLDYIDAMTSSIPRDANLGLDLGNFITGYTAFLQDFTKNGTNNLLPILEKNPIIIANSSGAVIGNEYVYPVTLSQSGIMSLLGDFSLKYSGTGISAEMNQELSVYLSGITSTGELRISTGEPTYFSLTLSISGSGYSDNPIQIDIHSKPESYILKGASQSGSITSTYTHKDWEKSRYILNLTKWDKTSNIIEYAGNVSPTNIDANFVFLDPTSENTVSAKVQFLQDDGTFAYTMNQSKGDQFWDIIDLSGVYGSRKITALTWILNLPESRDSGLSLEYNRTEDDSFSLSIKTPSGRIQGDGSLRKNDIKINMTAQWFSATFEQKIHEDGSWDGKFQLPVWLIRWNGKTENEVLSDFHIKWTSPFGWIDLDLTKKDDSVIWPYSINIQWVETSSGTISLRKIPKNFDIRLDTTFPGMDAPSFFKFHNFTDLRWDKDAKVIEPENAESLTPFMKKMIEEDSSYKKLQTTPSSAFDFTDL